MKRFFCFLMTLVISAGTGGCMQDYDFPTDTKHEGSRWTAQEANVYFDISNKYYEGGITNSFGEINKSNENIKFYIATRPSGVLDFYIKNYDKEDEISEENLILRGKIKTCNDDEFVLKVDEEYQSFFGEEIKTLTFVREPTPGYVEYVKPE